MTFSKLFSRQALNIDWKDGQGELEKIQMANDCDFAFDDLYNKSASSGDECAKFCREEKRCTHFTYSTFFGKYRSLRWFVHKRRHGRKGEKDFVTTVIRPQ